MVRRIQAKTGKLTQSCKCRNSLKSGPRIRNRKESRSRGSNKYVCQMETQTIVTQMNSKKINMTLFRLQLGITATWWIKTYHSLIMTSSKPASSASTRLLTSLHHLKHHQTTRWRGWNSNQLPRYGTKSSRKSQKRRKYWGESSQVTRSRDRT